MDSTQPQDPTPDRPRSRRSLLVGAMAGVAGVAVGTGGAYGWKSTFGGEPAKPPAPTPSRKPVARMEGFPPQPSWYVDLKGEPVSNLPLCWNDRVILVPAPSGIVGLDLVTGKKLWTRSDLPDAKGIQLVGDIAVLGTDKRYLLGFNPLTGKDRWIEKEYMSGGVTTLDKVLASHKRTLFFTGVTKSGEGKVEVVAYDLDKREERWRFSVTKDFLEDLNGGPSAFALSKQLVLVDGASFNEDGEPTDKPLGFTTVDYTTGKELSQATIDDVPGDSGFHVSDDGIAVLTVHEELVAVDIRSGKELWTYEAEAAALFGLAEIYQGRVYVTSAANVTFALNARSGDLVWQREAGASVVDTVTSPRTLLTPSGRTVLASRYGELNAFDAKSGNPLWRLADRSATWDAEDSPSRRVLATKDTLILINGTDVHAFPVT